MTKTLKNDENVQLHRNTKKRELEKVVNDIYEVLAPDPEHRRIIGQILQLLSDGYPVSLGKIVKQLQVPPDRVTSILNRFGAEFDQEGNILGLGLTLVTTPYVCEVNGRKMYTWCAVDALSFPVILKQTASIESSDPVTGEKIQVSVTPDRVEKIEPKNAVVSYIKNIGVTNVRGGCNNIRYGFGGDFFSSPKTATKWIAEHPDTTFYPVNEVYQALKQSPLKTYGDIIVQSKQEEKVCHC